MTNSDPMSDLQRQLIAANALADQQNAAAVGRLEEEVRVARDVLTRTGGDALRAWCAIRARWIYRTGHMESGHDAHRQERREACDVLAAAVVRLASIDSHNLGHDDGWEL